MDYPVEEMLKEMEKWAAMGAECYVKFTCESCGSRQTASDANSWHPVGYTCEECGHLTVPKAINFMLVKQVSK